MNDDVLVEHDDASTPLSAEELESLARSRYAPILDSWLIAGEDTA